MDIQIVITMHSDLKEGWFTTKVGETILIACRSLPYAILALKELQQEKGPQCA
jgi:hypothetical protein